MIPTDFENEVRRIARQLWPDALNSGARILDGRERDGVFETEEIIHIIEATTSRQKQKALNDLEKTSIAIKARRKNTNKPVKGWFVTLHEPTADQRTAGKRYERDINIMSFNQFQSKLINANEYLNIRENYRFGSIQNPENETETIKKEDYIELDIIEQNSNTSWNTKSIAKEINEKNSRFIITGDYGAGKSMTVRDIYYRLRAEYFRGKTVKFPLFLNLRDHHGQHDPVEAIERHARLIGFHHPAHLVRAWRAGYIHLLIDGFDELATSGWVGVTQRLVNIRYQAMELVRKLIKDTNEAGIILCGRSHYFDSDNEMRRALAINDEFIWLSLNEFTDEQIQKYIGRKNLNTSIPDWLPSRPLLVGYLVARGILENSGDLSLAEMNPATGWDHLIERICERESEIEVGIDPETVRELVERIATFARSTSDGLGPVLSDEVNTIFRNVCGYPPDDRAQKLLLRLPGLGPVAPEDSSRTFVDEDFADAATAGDIFRFVSDPFGFKPKELFSPQVSIGDLGSSVLFEKCQKQSFRPGKISFALDKSSNDADFSCSIPADLFKLMLEHGIPFEGKGATIEGCHIRSLVLDEQICDFSAVAVKDCIISNLYISNEVKDSFLPMFSNCLFGYVDGRVGRSDLPSKKFDKGCEFEEFSSQTTTSAAILRAEIPEGIAVLLTILRKLFLQSGSGRRNSALYRGLDHRTRRLVPNVLTILQSENIVTRVRSSNRTIWVPSRNQSNRIKKIINSPIRSNDSLVTRCGELD